jgi:hypothetical protein
MAENLHADLETLRREVAQKGRAPVILLQGALEQHFHGLTLGQIVKLTDAPALVAVADIQSPDGTRTERFCIDGRDPELCHAVARQFLLDPAAAFAPGHIREVRTCNDDVVRETMVRDHGVIYRVTNHEAIVDELLTRTLQTLRRKDAFSTGDVSSPSQSTVEADGAPAIGKAAARILRGLSDIRTCNAATRCVIAQLVSSMGEQDLETALEAADPESLRAAFRQILSASDEIETLLDGLTTQTNVLMQAARGIEIPDAPQEPIMAPESMSEQIQMGEPRTPF